MKKNEGLDSNELMEFIQTNVRNFPETITGKLKEKLWNGINEIVKNQVIITKRDPTVQRTSWFSAEPIPVEGRVAVFNSLYEPPLGADNDGDTVEICPLFTEESKEQAKEKMHPRYSKIMYRNPKNYNSMIYEFTLDQVGTIYMATKE